MIYSAGIILYRKVDNNVEFFVCTPGGPYWKNKESWNFPKGQIDGDEKPIETAIREFKEETNIDLIGVEDIRFEQLVKQRKDKSVYVFSKEYNGEDYSNCFSNTFEGEDGNQYPEIGDYKWMTLKEIIKRGGVRCYYELFDRIRQIALMKDNIYNMDCVEGMETKIPHGSIDCIICDLPYFEVVDAEFDNQWENKEHYMKWVVSVLVEFSLALKPGGSIFLFTSRQFNGEICYYLKKFNLEEKRIIIWARKRGFNNTRGKALASGYEPIAYYVKPGGEVTFNNIKIKSESNRKEYREGMLRDGVSLSDVWTDIPALPHNSKEKTAHPTQKPLKLIERIIEMSTNEGDLVLDACMGSGTTAVACMNTNRHFVGFEVDKNYYDIAIGRLTDIECEKLF